MYTTRQWFQQQGSPNISRLSNDWSGVAPFSIYWDPTMRTIHKPQVCWGLKFTLLRNGTCSSCFIHCITTLQILNGWLCAQASWNVCVNSVSCKLLFCTAHFQVPCQRKVSAAGPICLHQWTGHGLVPLLKPCYKEVASCMKRTLLYPKIRNTAAIARLFLMYFVITNVSIYQALSVLPFFYPQKFFTSIMCCRHPVL